MNAGKGAVDRREGRAAGQNECWGKDKRREGDHRRSVGGTEIQKEANEDFQKVVHLADQEKDTELFSHQISNILKGFSFGSH